MRPWLSLYAGHGPLFYSLCRSCVGGRLRLESVWQIVRTMGEAVGIRLRTHGIRHSSITAALDAGCGVRDVQRFARHASIDTTLRYDDNRQDLAGAVAAQVAEVLR